MYARSAMKKSKLAMKFENIFGNTTKKSMTKWPNRNEAGKKMLKNNIKREVIVRAAKAAEYLNSDQVQVCRTQLKMNRKKKRSVPRGYDGRCTRHPAK